MILKLYHNLTHKYSNVVYQQVYDDLESAPSSWVDHPLMVNYWTHDDITLREMSNNEIKKWIQKYFLDLVSNYVASVGLTTSETLDTKVFRVVIIHDDCIYTWYISANYSLNTGEVVETQFTIYSNPRHIVPET